MFPLIEMGFLAGSVQLPPSPHPLSILSLDFAWLYLTHQSKANSAEAKPTTLIHLNPEHIFKGFLIRIS